MSADTLARQLAQMGRDLDTQVTILGTYEDAAVKAEGRFRVTEALYEDALAKAVLDSEERSEASRKADARLSCISFRIDMQEASEKWNHERAKVRVQQASISALHRRVEIGRSLLSREKAQLSLINSGIDA